MKTLMLSVLALTMALGFVTTASAKAKTAKPIKGDFISLADDKKSIKVTTGGKKNPTETVVTVDDKTTVTLDGAAVTLTDLKAGQKLSITLNSTTSTAEAIEAKSSKKAK